MKQKHDVSIAGIAFQLDEEGYLLLDNYLSQIAAIYKNNPDSAEVLADIERRDEVDSNRSTAPLKPAEDALLLDSTGHYIEDIIETICSYARERMDQ